MKIRFGNFYILLTMHPNIMIVFLCFIDRAS